VCFSMRRLFRRVCTFLSLNNYRSLFVLLAFQRLLDMISASSCPIGLVDGSFYSGECEEDSCLFKCRKSTSAGTHQGRQLKTDGIDLSVTCLRPYARHQGRNRVGRGSDRLGHTQAHPNTCATTNLHPRTAIPLGNMLYAKKNTKIHAGMHTRTTNQRVTVTGGGG
jgi:hypothetical protein